MKLGSCLSCLHLIVAYCLSSSPSSQRYNTGWIEYYPVAAKCVLICTVGCHQRSYDKTGSDGVQCPRVVECMAQKKIGSSTEFCGSPNFIAYGEEMIPFTETT